MSVKLEAIVKLRDEFTKNSKQISTSINTFSGQFKKLGSSIKGAYAGLKSIESLLAIGAVTYATKSVLDSAMGFQGLSNAMKAAVGDFTDSTAELAYVRQEADRIGIGFEKISSDYIKFAASATRAGISLKETRKIFSDIAETSVSLKLSPERAKLVFEALNQIASKNVVQMEEIRGQLGDHLPAALNIAAKAMNMTVGEFANAVKNKEIIASEFLPKFAALVRSELGGSFDDASKQLAANVERMKNNFYDLKVEAGNTLLPIANEIIPKITDALKNVANYISQNKETFKEYYENAKPWLIKVKDLIKSPFESAVDTQNFIKALKSGAFHGMTGYEAGKFWDKLQEDEKSNLKNSQMMMQQTFEKYSKEASSKPSSYKPITPQKKEFDSEGWEKWIKGLEKVSKEENALNRRLSEQAGALFDKRLSADMAELKAKFDIKMAKQKQAAEYELMFRQMSLNSLEDGIKKELALIEFRYNRERELAKGNSDALRSINKAELIEKKMAEKAYVATVKENAMAQYGVVVDSLEQLSGKNKVFMAAYKAATIAQIIMDSHQAASAVFAALMKTSAFLGPLAIPLAVGGAGAVYTAGAARAADVAGLKFANGVTKYRTSGRTTMTFGDNPGGQEEITVRPLSSPNVSGPSGSGDASGATYIFNLRDYTGNLIGTLRRELRANREGDRFVRDVMAKMAVS